MARPSDPARHWLLVQSDKPGVSAGGISALFHGSGAPATVSLQRPKGIHHHTGRPAGRHGRYNCHLLPSTHCALCGAR